MKILGLLILTAGLAAACGERPDTAPGASPPAAKPPAGTPVRVASVASKTFSEIVSAPGHTSALAGQKVRAPFSGVLTDLRAADGDTVSRGQVLGTIVSRDSEAALAGAREMVREASSARQKVDAQRAIVLAQRNLVTAALRASASGMVVSHAANRGDRVAEGDEILTISAPDSIVFLADVPQSDLSRIRAGQNAEVKLGSRPQPIRGIVYAVLPAANAADFTASVRIDVRGVSGQLPAGLFGTAQITIARRPGILALPDAAILRDDVTGVSRVAIVERGRVQWIVVTTGLRENGATEVTSGNLTEGRKVVVSGQIGLRDASPVVIEP